MVYIYLVDTIKGHPSWVPFFHIYIIIPSGTILSGTGLYRDEEKNLIFVTVEARRITLLQDVIRQTDPDAFMVVMDAAEMLGRKQKV